YSNDMGFDLTSPIFDFGDLNMSPTDVIGNQHRLYEGMADIYQTKAAENWFLLGGDHSVSYSSIKAYAEQYTSFAVIQFDAHHDLRNTEDGGPTNGTPFRRLLEDGILKGEHLIQIGIRDFTNAKAYDDYAKDQEVTVHTMGDVNKQSVTSILRRELHHLEEKVDYIYISLDIDILDQSCEIGCQADDVVGMYVKSLV